MASPPGKMLREPKCPESRATLASFLGKMPPLAKMPSALGFPGLALRRNGAFAGPPRSQFRGRPYKRLFAKNERPSEVVFSGKCSWGATPGIMGRTALSIVAHSFGQPRTKEAALSPMATSGPGAIPLIIPGVVLQATFREKRTTIGSCIFGKMLLRDHPGNYGQNRAIERRP